MDLTAWALAALLAMLPHATRRPPPGWSETRVAYETRLASIAVDVAAVAHNKREAGYLVGVLVHESGADPDVDAGRCYRGPGWERRCDGGRAVSVWQLQDGDAERREVWRTDRRAAAREALRRIASSLRTCHALEVALRLSMFASGTCRSSGRAAMASRELFDSVQRALAHP